MKRAVLLLLLFCMLYPAVAQNRTKPVYQTQVILLDGTKLDGVLVQLGDSVLQLVPKEYVSKGKLLANAKRYNYAVREVEQLRIRRKSAALQGTLLGGGLGLIVGALVGYASYQPCVPTNTSSWFDCIEIFNQTESTIAGGTLGAILGAGVGSLAGSARRRIDIRGDRSTYLSEKEGLQPFVLQE